MRTRRKCVGTAKHFAFCRSYVVETARPERDEDCGEKERMCSKYRNYRQADILNPTPTPPSPNDPENVTPSAVAKGGAALNNDQVACITYTVTASSIIPKTPV